MDSVGLAFLPPQGLGGEDAGLQSSGASSLKCPALGLSGGRPEAGPGHGRLRVTSPQEMGSRSLGAEFERGHLRARIPEGPVAAPRPSVHGVSNPCILLVLTVTGTPRAQCGWG